MTHQQYRKFLQDWNIYKQLTQLSIRDSMHHLYNTCDESVQVSLISTYENFLELSEEEALDAIKTIATVRVNPAVHQKAFGEKEKLNRQKLWCET